MSLVVLAAIGISEALVIIWLLRIGRVTGRFALAIVFACAVALRLFMHCADHVEKFLSNAAVVTDGSDVLELATSLLILAGLVATYSFVKKLREQSDKLARSEIKYRNLMERTPDAILTVRLPKERITDCNQTAEQLTGYSREELIGRAFNELYDSASLTASRESLETLSATGELRDAHHRIVRRDGCPVDVSLNATLIQSPSGADRTALITLRDITELRRTSRQHEALNEVSHLLLTSRKLESIYRQLPEILISHLDFPLAFVDLFDRDSGEMILQGAAGIDRDLALPQTVDMDHARSGEVPRWGEPLYETYDAPKKLYESGALRDLTVRTFICVPVRSSGVTSGTITLASPEPQAIHDSLKVTLDLIATHLALTIENRYTSELLLNATKDWQDTFDIINDAITVYTKDFQTLHVNEAARQLMSTLGNPVQTGACYFSSAGGKCNTDQCLCKKVADEPNITSEELVVPDWGKTFEIRLYSRYDTDGNLLGYVHVATDVTQRVKHQEQMRRLTAAVNQSASMICIADKDGLIEYVNPRFTQVTGYTLEEVKSQPMSILKSGKQDDTFYRELWSTISSGGTWTGKLQNRCKNGELYWERQTISPVLDNIGNIINYVAVKEDISTEIMAQEQLVEADKMAAVGLLAAGVAHEFKNYLGGIIGNSSFALEQLRSEDDLPLARETLEQVIGIGERANELAMSLLTYSRSDSSDVAPEDLKSIVSNTLALVEKEMSSRAVEIATYFEPAPPVLVAAGRIQQVLLNLLMNAQQAIGTDGVITLALLNGDGCVHLKVGDSGGGIAEDVLPRIFDPFYSTKGVWGKDAVVGTGMGLTICRNIVREFHGDLTVETIPGIGSTFTLTLPAAEGSEQQLPEASFNGQGTRILVFSLNQAVTKRYFDTACAHDVDLVMVSDADGVAALLAQKVELVIIDAAFIGKMELYQVMERCRTDDVPYVVINNAGHHYLLEELCEGAVAVYPDFPPCERLAELLSSAPVEA